MASDGPFSGYPSISRYVTAPWAAPLSFPLVGAASVEVGLLCSVRVLRGFPFYIDNQVPEVPRGYNVRPGALTLDEPTEHLTIDLDPSKSTTF